PPARPGRSRPLGYSSPPRKPLLAPELEGATGQLLQRQYQQLTPRARQERGQRPPAPAQAPRPPQFSSAPRKSELVLEPRRAAGQILQRQNQQLTQRVHQERAPYQSVQERAEPLPLIRGRSRRD